APSPTERIIHRSIRTIPATPGASPTVLLSTTAVDVHDPAWSADGTRNIYVGGSSIRSILASGVPAGELGEVLVGAGGTLSLLSPIPSPVGSSLAFWMVERETTFSDIYLKVGAADPVNLTGPDSLWPPEELPAEPDESDIRWLNDDELLFVQG